MGHGQKRDIYILIIFQIARGLLLSEDQSWWALIIGQATVFRNFVLLLLIPYINLVGGLFSLSALLLLSSMSK